MNKKTLILIGLLVVVLAFAVCTYLPIWEQIFGKPSSRTGSLPAPILPFSVLASGEVVANAGSMTSAEAKLIDPFSYRIAVRKKASSPPSVSPGGPSAPAEEPRADEPVLQGIWVDEGMEVAFISSQTMNEGGTVLGWKVSSITKNYVVLIKGGKSRTLKLEVE